MLRSITWDQGTEMARRTEIAASLRIQDLYLAGRKDDAARAVPDELVSAVSLLGDENEVVRHLAEYRDAGVTTLLLKPLASTPEQRVKDVGRSSRLVRGGR